MTTTLISALTGGDPRWAGRGEFGQVLSEAESKQVQLVNDGPVMFLVVARGGALARET